MNGPFICRTKFYSLSFENVNFWIWLFSLCVLLELVLCANDPGWFIFFTLYGNIAPLRCCCCFYYYFIRFSFSELPPTQMTLTWFALETCVCVCLLVDYLHESLTDSTIDWLIFFFSYLKLYRNYFTFT